MAGHQGKRIAQIVGCGMTALRSGKAARERPSDAVALMVEALHLAVQDAGVNICELDTLIALPSLMSEQHFMIGHAVAQQAQLTPRKGMLVRTLDVGGAGPVAALLAAKHAVEYECRRAVAIVAGDTVASVPVAEFLARADGSCRPKKPGISSSDATVDGSASSSSSNCDSSSSSGDAWMPSPVIPNLYDRVARWHMQQYGTTRDQLAMCASLMTYQASHHPAALHRRPRLLQEVLASEAVAPVTSKLECAKLADGAACLLLVPGEPHFASSSSRAVGVLSGGEGSGPLYPPLGISEDCFSAGEAAAAAYERAGLTPGDIHYWGLYDCFPICLLRAIEAVGLAPQGMGGAYIQQQYARLLGPLEQHQQHQQQQQQQQQQHNSSAAAAVWPVNTHGGLLGFGAPWEVPAMHSLTEAVAQLRGEAAGRQVAGARRALVYGNGGVFSASAVAILESWGGKQHVAASKL